MSHLPMAQIVDDEHPVLRGQYTITMLDEAGGSLGWTKLGVHQHNLPLHRPSGKASRSC